MEPQRGSCEARFFAAFLLLAGIGLLLIFMVGPPRGRSHARHMSAVVQTAILEIALAEYRSELGCYPPDTGHGLDPAKSPGTYDAGSLCRHLMRPVRDPATGEEVGPFLNEWPKDDMAAYDDPKHGPSFRLTDPWGNPFGFVGERKRVVHKPGSFDLFSVGPDGVTASDEPDAASNLAYDGLDNDGNGMVDDASELGAAASNGDIGDDINNWSRR
jgi:hypothetical protein